jgi:hypothetical protein
MTQKRGFGRHRNRAAQRLKAWSVLGKVGRHIGVVNDDRPRTTAEWQSLASYVVQATLQTFSMVGLRLDLPSTLPVPISMKIL